MPNDPVTGGMILIDKPTGITSQTAVNAVRRAFGTRQAGHTGTLDPLASGLLCVLVGRAVKASEYLTAHDKSYEATLSFGYATDTLDSTGTVISDGGRIPSDEEVADAVRRFTGKQLQLPPMYSAIKTGGKKLYELAREGKTVEREPREINVYSMSSRRITETEWSLSIRCSAGTYVRSLCDDIGRSLGTYAVMSALRRTAIGSFSVSDATSCDALAGMTPGEVSGLIVPLSRVFADLPRVRLDPFFERLFRSGCAVNLKRADLPDLAAGTLTAHCGADGELFALGRVIETESGLAVKSEKLLILG